MSLLRKFKLITANDSDVTSTTIGSKIGLDFNIINDVLKVEFGNKGTTLNLYNEVNAVPVSASTLVNQYTVPVGKNFDLNKVAFSGDNIAKFTAKINNNTTQTKRTWFMNFNGEFDFVESILLEGDKIEIFVENRGEDATTFDATIIGGVYDA